MEAKRVMFLCKTRSAFCLVGLVLAPIALAQTASAPPSPVKQVEQASIAYEQMKIQGREQSLNLRTLAALQRASQENALKEKIAKVLNEGSEKPSALMDPNRALPQLSASAVQQLPPALPAGGAQSVGSVNAQVSTPTVPKQQTVVPGTLLSIFGQAGQLKAEIYTGNQSTQVLSVGDQYSGWKITAIRANGLSAVDLRRGRNQELALGGKLR